MLSIKHSTPLDIDVSLVDKAVSLWRDGELVAMPTETVYGLAADATNGAAVARIYAAKARPQFNPLIAHVADAAMAQRDGVWNDAAETLAAAFWPGPLTLVLQKTANGTVHDLVSAGGDTIAVRAPSHPAAQRLLRAFGKPLAAPSANRSGRISPTTAQHVRDELGNAVALVIDGGACAVGLESTVIDLSGGAPRLLRPGSITQAMVEYMIGPILVGAEHGAKLHAPGMLESHYAPNLPVLLNQATRPNGAAWIGLGTIEGDINLSPRGDLGEAAANLFAALRTLDRAPFAAIAVAPIPRDGIGAAINDRLQRAAAPRR